MNFKRECVFIWFCVSSFIKVDHFTKYGLNEQLFADDDGPEDLIQKLKLAAQKKEAARIRVWTLFISTF